MAILPLTSTNSEPAKTATELAEDLGQFISDLGEFKRLEIDPAQLALAVVEIEDLVAYVSSELDSIKWRARELNNGI